MMFNVYVLQHLFYIVNFQIFNPQLSPLVHIIYPCESWVIKLTYKN